MIITGKTKLLGVFGQPVSHTLSPIMQNALLQHLGINAVYLPLPSPVDKLAEAVQGFRNLGFVGANVTIPFKEAMVNLVDGLTPISQFMGSVNTLFWQDGLLMGTTTDAYGALNNLLEHGHQLGGKRVALLGNGGASRALAFALMQKSSDPTWQTPASVTLFGRDPRKLEALCKELQSAGLALTPQFRTLDQFASCSTEYDLLINGTSVGMSPQDQEIPVAPEGLHSGLVVYDIVYTPAETRLLREARLRGCKTVPGIGMLIHQGALSFDHWFPGLVKDRAASVQIMRAAIDEFRAKQL